MGMMLRTGFVVCCALLASTSVAQQRGRGTELIEAELEKKQRELAESESRLNRLQELRLRLGLGLPIRAGRYLQLTAEQRELAGESGPERLVTEESEVQRLSMQASTLAEQLDSARNELQSRSLAATNKDPAENREDGPVTHVPVTPDVGHVGTEPHRPVVDLTPKPHAGSQTDHGPVGHPPAMPAGPEPVAEGSSKLIVGSRSRSDVGRVLLRAAENLLRRAQREADAAKKQQLDLRAKEMLEAAKRELSVVAKAKKPKLIDLYHLARCEEKLGNIASADSYYAQIISRDMTIAEDGSEQYGKWGRAAQAAKSVLRWVSDEGGWQPARDIESIRWDQN